MRASRSDHGGNRYYEAREHRARLKSGETTESSIVELRQDSKNFADGISESKIAMSLEAARKSKGDGSNPSWTACTTAACSPRTCSSCSALLPALEGRILQAMSAFEVQPLEPPGARGVRQQQWPSRRSLSPMPSSFRASLSFRDEPGLVDPLPLPRLDDARRHAARTCRAQFHARNSAARHALTRAARVHPPRRHDDARGRLCVDRADRRRLFGDGCTPSSASAAASLPPSRSGTGRWRSPTRTTCRRAATTTSRCRSTSPTSRASRRRRAREPDLARTSASSTSDHGFVPIGQLRVRGFVAMELVERVPARPPPPPPPSAPAPRLRRRAPTRLARTGHRAAAGARAAALSGGCAARRGSPLFLAIRWSVRLARTLAHLHSRRVIHRDVKLPPEHHDRQRGTVARPQARRLSASRCAGLRRRPAPTPPSASPRSRRRRRWASTGTERRPRSTGRSRPASPSTSSRWASCSAARSAAPRRRPPHLKLKSSAQSALYSVVPHLVGVRAPVPADEINPRWPHPNLVAVARDAAADPSPTRRPTAAKVADLLRGGPPRRRGRPRPRTAPRREAASAARRFWGLQSSIVVSTSRFLD